MDGFTTVAEHSSCAARGLTYEAAGPWIYFEQQYVRKCLRNGVERLAVCSGAQNSKRRGLKKRDRG